MAEYQESKYEHDPNRGSLFKNEKKETDKHPSWKGDALLDLGKLGIGSGQSEVDLSIWVNKTKKGDKYLKINIDPPYQAETENKPEGKKDDEDDDDIPF